MSYLGPDNMELPEEGDAAREPFSIMPGNKRLAAAQIKTIEQGYELQFDHPGEDVSFIRGQVFEVTAPNDPEKWWSVVDEDGAQYEFLLMRQLELGYTITVTPR